MDKESFEVLLGSLTELVKRGKDGTATVAKATRKTAMDTKRFGVIKFKDLKKRPGTCRLAMGLYGRSKLYK